MRRAVLIAVLPITVLALVAVWNTDEAHGAGLKTTFVRVSLDNLRTGGTYNIREMANLPLAVYNTGDAPISLRVEATTPTTGETREGYEPIPDPAWISFKQDTFEVIEPNQAAMTDVVIAVPDDPRHLGKRYQVMIWSHTVGGGLVACGLKSEVLFTVSSVRGEPPKGMGLLPTEIVIPSAEAGRPFNVKKEGSGVTLKVFNPFNEERTVIVTSVPVGSSPLKLREGYLECPDPSVLELAPSRIVVPARGDRSIEMALRLPGGDRMRGKSYMFAIAATEVGASAPASYSAVYITVK